MIGRETIGHLDLTLKAIKQNSLLFCGVSLLAVGQLPSLGEGILYFFYGLDQPLFFANQNNDTDFTYKYFFFFTTYISSNMIFF